MKWMDGNDGKMYEKLYSAHLAGEKLKRKKRKSWWDTTRTHRRRSGETRTWRKNERRLQQQQKRNRHTINTFHFIILFLVFFLSFSFVQLFFLSVLASAVCSSLFGGNWSQEKEEAQLFVFDVKEFNGNGNGIVCAAFRYSVQCWLSARCFYEFIPKKRTNSNNSNNNSDQNHFILFYASFRTNVKPCIKWPKHTIISLICFLYIYYGWLVLARGRRPMTPPKNKRISFKTLISFNNFAVVGCAARSIRRSQWARLNKSKATTLRSIWMWCEREKVGYRQCGWFIQLSFGIMRF